MSCQIALSGAPWKVLCYFNGSVAHWLTFVPGSLLSFSFYIGMFRKDGVVETNGIKIVYLQIHPIQDEQLPVGINFSLFCPSKLVLQYTILVLTFAHTTQGKAWIKSHKVYQTASWNCAKHISRPCNWKKRAIPKCILFLDIILNTYSLSSLRPSEYYFSLDNLERDFFLRRKMDQEGFLPIGLIASFHRVQALTTDLSLILQVTLPLLSKVTGQECACLGFCLLLFVSIWMWSYDFNKNWPSYDWALTLNKNTFCLCLN